MSLVERAGAAALRACVVAAPGFEALAHGIELSLRDVGLQSRVGWPDEEDTAIVLLLSRELPEGLSELTELLPGRLVPVKVGNVDEALLPQRLASLNWIPWSPGRSRDAIDAISRACVTDLRSFFEVQSLEARAAGWESSGRGEADLIRTRRELRQLLGAFEGGLELTPSAQEFIRRSSAATRASERRSRYRGIFWTALSIAIVVGVLQSMVTLQGYEERRNLYLVASSGADSLFPVAQVPKFAALVLLSEEAGEPAPFEAEARLARLLSEPSPVQAFVGAPNNVALTATAIGADGRMLQVGGDGLLWRGAVGRADLEQTASVPHPGTLLVADAALETWAVADDTRVTASQAGQTTTLRTKLAGGAESLRMQRDGAALAVLGVGAAEIFAVGGSVELVRSVSGVLAASEVGGRLVLVIAEDEVVRVVDAMTGERLSEVGAPADVQAATVLADGALVLVAGERLWKQDGEGLTSVGLAVPTSVTQLEATSRGEVLVATVGDGARLIDVDRGVRLAQICREGAVTRMDLSIGSDWVVCNYGATGWIWDTRPFRPTGPGDAGAKVPADVADVASEDTAVRVVDGVLGIARGDLTTTHDVAMRGKITGDGGVDPAVFVHGELTAVGVLPGGRTVAYGTDLGEVVVADLSPALELLVTQSWVEPNGSPVRSLRLESGRLEVATASARWRLSPCTECRIDRARLLQAQAERQLPCYLTDYDGAFPTRISERLGLTVCPGGA